MAPLTLPLIYSAVYATKTRKALKCLDREAAGTALPADNQYCRRSWFHTSFSELFIVTKESVRTLTLHLAGAAVQRKEETFEV